jgi:hypothetical protein
MLLENKQNEMRVGWKNAKGSSTKTKQMIGLQWKERVWDRYSKNEDVGRSQVDGS